jgi:hypothetical protein
MIKADHHNKAYWYGWNDGRYREQCCFTENHRLAELKARAQKTLLLQRPIARAGKLVGIAATFSGPKAPPT